MLRALFGHRGRVLAPPLDAAAEDSADPALSAAPIHVLVDSGLVHLDDGLIVVRNDEVAAAPVRLGEIAQLSIHGEAGITTPCLRALMQRGIPVVFRSRSGHYAGQTVDLSGNHSAVRRAQYRAANDARTTLALARGYVHAKLINAGAVLRRRGSEPAAVATIGGLVKRARAAGDLEVLRGMEGAAAAIYFAAFARLLRSDGGFVFAGRNRKPPADPVNALLSYLYAILTGECAAAALAAGLDPHVGFLHAERPGRPALALDLVEPLRPFVCDSVALALINRSEIARADFSGDAANGFRLSDAARRIVLTALERRLAQAFGDAGDVRAAIAADARALAAALRRGAPHAPLLLAG